MRRDLSLRAAPFTFEEAAVATSGVAGIVQLGPNAELEVVPKCFAPGNPAWRDDFLFMATVTRLARIFRRERVSATRRENHSDLLSLLADIFLDELERWVRVPIREYGRFAWTSPDIDGDLAYPELWEPRPEGLPQMGSRLSTDNAFMGTISEAAEYLGKASTDRGVRQRLQRVASPFRASVNRRRPTRVPGRYAHWQELYDLARDVLAGHGMQLESTGRRRAPGFVLNTERCWEDVLALALMTRRDSLGTKVKPRLTLGERFRGDSPRSPEAVSATPDILLDPPSLRRIVVDAKYKGSAQLPITAIDRADVYEALGFMQAAACDIAILVHPDSEADSAETGAVTRFDEVVIDHRRVIGVTLNMRGIGRVQGLLDFGHRFGEGLLEFAMSEG